MLTRIILLSILLSICSLGYTQEFNFTDSFFPTSERLKNEDVQYGYLTAPENWKDTSGQSIKMATLIIKSKSKEKNEAVLYLEGGPGQKGIYGIYFWLDHPMRENNDIVLVDIRGTGLSKPSLCPSLGKSFFEILAKDQSKEEDESEKVKAAMQCQLELQNKGMDISAYHTKSITKDLNALKNELGYDKWHVYGVSYGTHMAQEYANEFPTDINSLVLDSSIPDISEYYIKNTSNYIGSLNKVFDACRNDPDCNKAYPDVKQKYYETIQDLKENPITVEVDESLIPGGEFTYNVEDFKIAIHQALYQKELIEVVPLLIYQFNARNKTTLGMLVAAFSGALGMDYGVYYCIICNEVLPYNTIEEFQIDADRYKQLEGGLSFYSSDYKVCEKWSPKKNNQLDTLNKRDSEFNFPVMVFSGYFDPITPSENALQIATKYKNTSSVQYKSSGHAPSFDKKGSAAISQFIEESEGFGGKESTSLGENIDFVENIIVNGGVVNMANSLDRFDILFFVPIIIALLIVLLAIFGYAISLFKRRDKPFLTKLLKISVIASSVLAIFILVSLILGISDTSKGNFYILAFGLPNSYNYLFILLFAFLGLLSISIIFFLLSIKKLEEKTIMASVLFSLLLFAIYFSYWGFF